jgi:hypothetical protein
MDVVVQIFRLLVLAIPIAWASWTVTHEDVFREFKDYCMTRSKTCQRISERKFFYLFTCEYCFSHWCTLLLQLLFQFKLVFDDWRGYLVSIPALIWVANIYMNLYQRTRVDIRKQRAIADKEQVLAEEKKAVVSSLADGLEKS